MNILWLNNYAVLPGALVRYQGQDWQFASMCAGLAKLQRGDSTVFVHPSEISLP